MADAKRKTWIIAALLALLALVATGVWWTQRDEGRANANGATEAADSAERDDALERKRAARSEVQAPERVAIGGRVTQAEDGTGIAGAVVLLTRKGLVQGQAPSPGEPTVPLTATTDADGSWTLASVDPGGYLLSATADGFLPATNDEVRVTGRDGQTNLDLSMRPGGALLSGTVSDIGGGPVEGVLVRISGAEQINLGFANPPLAAISDADGQYRVQLATGRYAITTFHPDYVAELRQTDLREQGRREDFKLIPGATIEGVVLAGPEGDPVANAHVSFSDSRNGGFGGASPNASVDGSVVVTDEQGRFRLTGVRAGVVGLAARAAGHASVAPEEVAVGIGETITDVELWVTTAYTISGYVVPKGEPEGGIEGVLVGAWQMQPPGILTATTPTASDGYFEILGVRPGAYQVGAIGEDHLLTLNGASATIVDQDVEELLIELETGITLRGRVDPGMRAQVSVELSPDSFSLTNIGGALGDALANTATNDDGTFEIGPLRPGTGLGGREVVLVAETDEGFRGTQVVQLRREDIEGVVVAMTKGASVSGTVLDSKGVPQRGVVVSVTPADPKPGGSPQSVFGTRRGDSAPTGDDGKFSVRGLELGNHHVIAKHRGRSLAWADAANDPETGEPKPIEINFEDTVNEQFLDLRVAPRDAEIGGVVLDAEGLPVADAWVRASLDRKDDLGRRTRRNQPKRVEGVVPKHEDAGKGGPPMRLTFGGPPPVLTDENGLFVIKDLARDGDYRLVAEGERGGARATQESVAPGTRVTLTLEQLGGLDGVVTLDGKPVAEYSVEIVGPMPRTKQVAHPRGEFRIDRLDPGKYELFVRADAGIGEAEVELGEDSRARVEIELQRSGTLKGQVIGDKDGEPIAGLRIMVTSEGRPMDLGASFGVLMGQGPQTDADGRFEVPNVSPGKGQIAFMDPSAQLSGLASTADAEFELEPGAVEDLGTIEAMQDDGVPKDERGTLQMGTRQATWAMRPRPPGTDLDAEEPDEQADADETKRLWVWSVDVGGVAERAGVVPGDEIVRIDGESVATIGASMAANRLTESRLRIGQKVRFELMRDGDAIDLSLEAVAKPE